MKTSDTFNEVLISDIYTDNDFNCRGDFAPIDVSDLAKSIQANGLIQPVTLEKWDKDGFKYRLIAGYRRTFTHKVLGLKKIKAIIREPMSDIDAIICNLSENISRADLNVLQEAKAISKLKAMGLPRTKVAEMIGQSSGWVQVRFMLLDLPEDIQLEAAAGYINQTGIREVFSTLKHKGKEAAYETVKGLKEQKLTGRKRTNVLASHKNQRIETKRMRVRGEIFEMNEYLIKHIGAGLTTVALSWAAGESTNMELYLAIKEEADTIGRNYNVPTE